MSRRGPPTSFTNLLVLARGDQRAGRSPREPLDLREVIAHLETRFRVVADRNQLQFEVSQGDQPLSIVGNPQELDNLFTILLDNAMKYTPAGGSVRVELARDGEECSATVQDAGIGISEQDLSHIFDRFYRADKARSMGGGAGLGLSIARFIADAHGATITVSSLLGQGSKFCVRFPIGVA